jgi:nucleoid-associated protein YgaU
MKSGHRPDESADENPYTQFHVVAEGDTLASIAEYFYGGAEFSGKILEANRDTLPSSESLRPGQRLIIP